jgi:hypothetical protein
MTISEYQYTQFGQIGYPLPHTPPPVGTSSTLELQSASGPQRPVHPAARRRFAIPTTRRRPPPRKPVDNRNRLPKLALS